MMRKILIALLIFFSYISLHINAQPICSIRTFNIRDGLAANIIASITQTNDNMMWFATWNGLCCYDGYKFTTFKNTSHTQQVLSTNRLLNVKANKFGDIWCITYDKQVNFFSTHDCQFINICELLKKKYNLQKISTDNVYPLRNGFTWIISSDGSGVNFRSNDNEGDNGNNIEIVKGRKLNKVMLDNDNHEWLFSKKKLERWDNHFTCPVGFDFMLQYGKKIFFASPGNDFGCYQNGKMRLITLPSSIKSIYCMERYDNNTILLGTNNGIISYNINTAALSQISILHPNQHSNDANKIFVDASKRIWAFSSGDGIIMINPRTKVTEWFNATASSPNDVTSSSLPFIHQDKYGTIWTIPNNGTFAYYNEKQHKLITYPLLSKDFKNICLPYISKYYIDAQNNLWFSGQHDLSLVNFKYQNITFKSVNQSHEVRATFYDHKGQLWIGDDKGNIMLYDKNDVLLGYLNKSGKIQKGETTFSNKVYGFYEDRKKRIWICTKGAGLFCLDNGQLHNYTYNPNDKWSISHNNIYDISEDGKGRLWVASFEKGINLISEDGKGGLKFFNDNNILRSFPKSCNKIRRIAHTKDGIILLSTSDGLVTFSDKFTNPGKIKFYHNYHVFNDTTTLLSSDVLQTFASKNGDIYVITLGGGLQKINSRNLLQDKLDFSEIHMSWENEGFFLSAVEDKQGKIWFVKENTLDVFNPQTGESFNYDPYDIDKRTEFSEAKPAYNVATGKISIGMVGGFISLFPERIKKSTYSPKIAFVNVQFQGEGQTIPILNKDELDVPADKRNLTITFSALDYNNNELIKYAYMLEGIDRKWNFVGNSHSASFNDLPPGHHRLIVRSTNSDGVWMQNEKVLKIYSHPSFWESKWAWPVYIILLFGIIFIVSYIYLLRERNKMNKEMNEMKTNFFNNIGHKLRTPLTLIGGPVTELLKKNDIKDEYVSSLKMIQRNSRNMLQLVNNMLNYNSSDNYFVDDINAPVFAEQEEKNAVNTPLTVKENATKLLIVEDNDDLRSFLASILCVNYNVITAENGKNGLDKAVKEMPDFIITDVMMPEMDGLTMVHNIKQDKNISHIPIIVLSAKASIEDRIKGLKEGIDDYITKPFSATYLKQRVENIIGQRHIIQQKYLEQMKDIGNEDGAKTEFKLEAPEIIDNDKVMVNKLMSYIEENIGNPDLKIDDLSAAVNLGRTVFYGKVKSIIGMTPIDFVRHLRIQRAEEMVANSKESLSQIAYSVGFSDPKYFTKCFKKETGMTPSEYRQKVKV